LQQNRKTQAASAALLSELAMGCTTYPDGLYEIAALLVPADSRLHISLVAINSLLDKTAQIRGKKSILVHL
jgi:hypothetical protein